MKGTGWRVWAVLTGLALAGCGALDTPNPLAGDLLSAPTTLNVGGRVVTAEAMPGVSGAAFRVQVRIKTARPPLPQLNVTGVFIVTDSGVWKASVPAEARSSCGPKFCVQGTARGLSRDFQVGQGVQVVTRLQDAQGRTYLLRDAEVRVQAFR